MKALALILLLSAAAAFAASPDSSAPNPHRGFRTFLPKPGDAVDDPACQLAQVLLDRQDKGETESYMIQVLFRGKPARRNVRVLDDRVEIDFLDAGKPAIRPARIRGGVVEASSMDEFFYRESPAQGGKAIGVPRIKRMVRLTLYTKAKPDLSFRDTLDRTLIHFRVPKRKAEGK
jgi:hypothetical protein